MPLISSGMKLTPARLNSALLVSKPIDESVINNATLQDDDHLFLSVEATGAYDMTLRAFINANVNPDLKVGWSAPSGSTMVWGVVDVQAGTTAGKRAITDTEGVVTSGANQMLLIVGTLFVGSTAGTFRFRWAQNGANAAASTVQAGSTLRLDRVA